MVVSSLYELQGNGMRVCVLTMSDELGNDLTEHQSMAHGF